MSATQFTYIHQFPYFYFSPPFVTSYGHFTPFSLIPASSYHTFFKYDSSLRPLILNVTVKNKINCYYSEEETHSCTSDKLRAIILVIYYSCFNI